MEEERTRLKVSKNNCLRRIAGATRMDGICNDDVQIRTGLVRKSDAEVDSQVFSRLEHMERIE